MTKKHKMIAITNSVAALIFAAGAGIGWVALNALEVFR